MGQFCKTLDFSQGCFGLLIPPYIYNFPSIMSVKSKLWLWQTCIVVLPLHSTIGAFQMVELCLHGLAHTFPTLTFL